MTDPNAGLEATGAPKCASCGRPVEPHARYCPSCAQTTGAPPPDVDIAGWIQAGWNLFVKHPGPAILLPLVLMVLAAAYGLMIGIVIAAFFAATGFGDVNWASLVAGAVGLLGLLQVLNALVAPALTAGVYACFLTGIRTGRLTAEHLGDGFRNWWACTWVAWVLGLALAACVPFVIVLVGIPAFIGVISLMWLATLHIVDRRQGGAAALSFAWRVMQGRLWMMLLFTLATYALMYAGALGFSIGLLITTPIALAALAAGYDALSRKEGSSG